jgi:protein-S-isoprenylcysteine O-methyltransferase Ste14
MNDTTDPLYWPVCWAVIACWCGFAIAFLLRKRSPGAPKHARRNRSVWGVALMAAGMALVWSIRRPAGAPLLTPTPAVAYAIDILCIAIAMASAGLVLAAVRELGKQWNVNAALVDGHRLVRSGPYGFVRHPIYLGMLGMMISTGIALSHWPVLLIAIGAGLAGTLVRIHFEELLLLEAFGREFEEYRASVRAIVPWVY